MKKLVLVFFVALAVACSSEQAKNPQSDVFIEKQLSEFIASNPDWTKDEATEKETTEKFKHKLINLSNEADFLNNMPLQLKEIKDTVIKEQELKMATFKAYGDTSRHENPLLNFIQLEISGIVSDEQAKKLTPNKNYQLKGTLYKQGKRADVKFIHVADFKGYDLGKYTFLITGFTAL